MPDFVLGIARKCLCVWLAAIVAFGSHANLYAAEEMSSGQVLSQMKQIALLPDLTDRRQVSTIFDVELVSHFSDRGDFFQPVKNPVWAGILNYGAVREGLQNGQQPYQFINISVNRHIVCLSLDDVRGAFGDQYSEYQTYSSHPNRALETTKLGGVDYKLPTGNKLSFTFDYQRCAGLLSFRTRSAHF